MIQKNAVQARWRHLHHLSRAERANYGYLNPVLQGTKYYEWTTFWYRWNLRN